MAVQPAVKSRDTGKVIAVTGRANIGSSTFAGGDPQQAATLDLLHGQREVNTAGSAGRSMAEGFPDHQLN
jgi:hypothetical protein